VCSALLQLLCDLCCAVVLHCLQAKEMRRAAEAGGKCDTTAALRLVLCTEL
jgi:hypothetical protein